MDNSVFDDTNITFEMLDKAVSKYAENNLSIIFEIEYYEEDYCIRKSY